MDLLNLMRISMRQRVGCVGGEVTGSQKWVLKSAPCQGGIGGQPLISDNVRYQTGAAGTGDLWQSLGGRELVRLITALTARHHVH